MWFSRKHKQIDSETLTEVPRKIRFNLFHRPKEIVGKGDGSKAVNTVIRKPPCLENRPKVNLFPQISLNDLRGKEHDNVLGYMYNSDWKEASTYSTTVSCMNLEEVRQLNRDDITNQYPDRFRKKSQKPQRFDLPKSEVNLPKWYKSFK